MVKKVLLSLVFLFVFEAYAFQRSSSAIDPEEDKPTANLLTHASVDYSALDELGDLEEQLKQLSVVMHEPEKQRDGAIAPSPLSPKKCAILKAISALVVTTKHRSTEDVQEDLILRTKRQLDNEDFYQYGPLTPSAKRFSPFSSGSSVVWDDEKENYAADDES